MMESNLSARLEAHGIRPTAIRQLVLGTFGPDDRAYSLSELEAKLGTVDKSTLFRTLTLLWEKGLLHSIEDSQGLTRYALCADDCHCHDQHDGLADLHPHFECERCKKVWCLKADPLPAVALPEGFHQHSASYVVKGLCPKCGSLTPSKLPTAL